MGNITSSKPMQENTTMTRLISIKEAELIFGRKRNWLYRLERDGVLPKAVKLNGRTIGWEQTDIEEFIKSQKN